SGRTPNATGNTSAVQPSTALGRGIAGSSRGASRGGSGSGGGASRGGVSRGGASTGTSSSITSASASSTASLSSTHDRSERSTRAPSGAPSTERSESVATKAS